MGKAYAGETKHEITRKEDLNSEDYLIEVRAPTVAKKWKAGQFVVLLTHPKGERIPMSLQKAEDGKITMFIKRLGKTSCELYTYKVGDSPANVIGPMFNAHKVNFKRTHNNNIRDKGKPSKAEKRVK